MSELIERNQVGKREDLADVIHVADARTTPLISMIPKGKEITNPLMQWQADDYPDPSFGGVVDEQDVETFENLSPNRAILSGRVQIFERKPKVSRLANTTDVAGIGKKKEFAKQVSKALVLIKRDMESAFCSDQDSRAGTGAVGYRTRGIGSWIASSAQTDLPVDSNYLTPAASIDSTAIASQDEEGVNDVLESIYSETGVAKRMVLLAARKLKRRITQFSIWQPDVSATVSALRTYQQSDNKQIVATIDFLEGDFGSLEIHLSNFLAQDQAAASQIRRGYVLDMDLLELRYNVMPNFRELENKGGGPRGIVEAIAGLVCGSPLALGKFNPTS